MAKVNYEVPQTLFEKINAGMFLQYVEYENRIEIMDR